MRDLKLSVKFTFGTNVWTALVCVSMNEGIKSRTSEKYVSLELPFIRHAYKIFGEELKSVDKVLHHLAVSLKSMNNDLLAYSSSVERLLNLIMTDLDTSFKTHINARTDFYTETVLAEAGLSIKRARTEEEIYRLQSSTMSFLLWQAGKLFLRVRS